MNAQRKYANRITRWSVGLLVALFVAASANAGTPLKGFNHDEHLIFRTAAVPEPATLAISIAGGAWLFGRKRRR